MKPVWIKCFGSIPMTKRGYLITLFVVCLGAALILLLLLLLLVGGVGAMPPLDTLWSIRHHIRDPGPFTTLHNYLYLIVLGCLIGLGFDTCFTLRAFKKKEEEEKARLIAAWEQLDEERRRPPDPHLRPGQ